MYHIFIQSSVNGHLGCLVIVNSAVDSGVRFFFVFVFVFFELLFSPDRCPAVGLLDHMVVLYLVF